MINKHNQPDSKRSASEQAFQKSLKHLEDLVESPDSQTDSQPEVASQDDQSSQSGSQKVNWDEAAADIEEVMGNGD